MNIIDENKNKQGSYDRRQFLKGAGIAGATMVAGGILAGCGGNGVGKSSSSSTTGDQAILGAAKIAEALAVSMYSAFIASPMFAGLGSGPQAYFNAAVNEEMFHYLLLKSATGNTDAQTTYHFPTGMFTDVQTTFNVIATLEEAFVAAYLVGVKDLSTPGLRVLAAQIMGIESDHLTLAIDAAGDAGLSSVTGLSGSATSVTIPNNRVYEQTFGLSTIGQVVAALTPFLSASASNSVVATFNPAFVPTASGLVGNPPA